MSSRQPRIHLKPAALTTAEAQATLARMAEGLAALQAQHKADALERAALQVELADLRRQLAARDILAPVQAR